MKHRYGIKILVVMALIMIIVGGGSTFNEVNKPSTWAEKEIAAAIEKNIVPQELQANYQKPIKRYEYALLALELLESSGNVVSVKYPYPFMDINNHSYERDIVLAYNAGLISGYTDGTFRPDAEITRQEVTMMLVNLIKAIKSDKDTSAKELNQFSDSGLIGKWALDSVNYCFNNDIVKGIGKDKQGLDIMSPNGTTSIEQAIAMIHRLGNTEKVFHQFNLGTIQLTEYKDDKKTIRESNVVNEFAVSFGEGLAKEVQNFSQLENIEVNSMTNDYTYITSKGTGVFSILKSDKHIYIKGQSSDINKLEFVNMYKGLVDTIDDSSEIDIVLADLIESIISEDKYSVTSIVGQSDRITVYKEVDINNNGKMIYDIFYTKVLN
ncbi:MAG: uncharacterized protein K0R15_80 [Clostridiales bacterium]|nr:uncharacterized protein [Clostridiales bacterium]